MAVAEAGKVSCSRACAPHNIGDPDEQQVLWTHLKAPIFRHSPASTSNCLPFGLRILHCGSFR
ncbi:hypothetical protein HPB50_007244 [Hyalomma asiaticum]|uniref:Uncharacterized protein n=1 Tax=Hyalomma asiaticum TaxID=266040 RepID=A0ACB7RJJ7_HYAAI|nr:hypothetical protein HPB50_007244 [Hyalomma asiaticum]